MSGFLEKYIPRTSKSVRKIHKRRERLLAHPGFMQPLLQTMIRIKNSGPGRGVFVFTGPATGAGVTYVSQVIARELSLETHGRVLIATSNVLTGASDPHLQRSIRGCLERAPNVWSALDDELIEQLPDSVLDRVWIDVAPQEFDFIVLDCPAVTAAGDALRLSPDADATFLVVAAGETTRAQIEHAQKLLRHASARLEGIILNRRTYPVPDFLYKML